MPYDDENITEYHDIINWEIIHKSTQLKGIASDKYLSCKYVKMKLGKDLCPHRIAVYDSVEEIDLKKIIKMGNVVLKISNGNDDNIFISNNSKQDIEEIRNSLIFHFNRDYVLRIPSLNHLFSKKRIIVEKMFSPLSDLYEFKCMLFNRDIKMIMLDFYINNSRIEAYYDANFNCLKKAENYYVDLSKFNITILNELKSYAYKLSEDFPNFVRVDLYIFHDDIYLSEITFDSHAGLPRFRDIKHFVNGIKTFKRVEY